MRSSLLALLASFPIVSATLAGCAAATDGDVGALGNGTFIYQCVDATDPLCTPPDTFVTGCSEASASGTLRDCFPSAVALGSRFRLSFRPEYSRAAASGNPEILASSSAFLEPLGGGIFFAKRAGTAAVLAKSSVTGSVIDHSHVRVAPVSATDLEIEGQPAPSSKTLARGDTVSLRARPRSRFGERLGGSTQTRWTTSDPSVIELRFGGNTSTMSLVALTSGTATVTAVTGDESGNASSITFTVSP